MVNVCIPNFFPVAFAQKSSSKWHLILLLFCTHSLSTHTHIPHLQFHSILKSPRINYGRSIFHGLQHASRGTHTTHTLTTQTKLKQNTVNHIVTNSRARVSFTKRIYAWVAPWRSHRLEYFPLDSRASSASAACARQHREGVLWAVAQKNLVIQLKVRLPSGNRISTTVHSVSKQCVCVCAGRRAPKVANEKRLGTFQIRK